MSNVRQKQIAVRVTDEEKTEFEKRAESEGKTPSQVLLEFVRGYIGQPIETGVEERVEQLEAEVRHLRQLENEVQQLRQYLGKPAA